MTEIQEVQLKLLLELDTLFNTNGISYFLVDSTAYYAVKKHKLPPNAQSLNIAIKSSDFTRLIEIFTHDLPDDRSFETLYNEPNLSSSYIRYIDESTLMLDLVNYNEVGKPGIAINICIARPVPKSRMISSFVGALEYSWRLYHLKPKEMHLRKRLLCTAMAFATKLLGRKNVARIVYRVVSKQYKSTGKYILVDPISESRGIRYHHRIFEKQAYVTIENISLPIPEAVRSYFSHRFEKKQKLLVNDYRKITFKCITSTQISYHEYIKRAKFDGIISNSILKKIRKYEMYESYYFVPYEVERERIWSIIERSEMRYCLNKVYSNKKDTLEALRSKGDYYMLHLELAEYIDALKYFSKRGLGLCFDSEIFAYAEDLLRHEGRYKYARKLRKLIPPEHMEAIKPS
jgi:phosphorylcholine metabolism protein LicD